MKPLFLLFMLLLPSAAPAADAPARITFYREKAFSGGIRKAPVFVDGVQIGDLTNGSRFTAELTPGKHAIRSGSKDQSIDLEIPAGAERYVRIESSEKGMRAIWRVLEVTAAQGKKDAARLPAVDPKHLKRP